jgi:demethylmenaquinone methyltransferase/2-methoxy-6-polyprenyl-1,4-benzoquinol methylase
MAEVPDPGTGPAAVRAMFDRIAPVYDLMNTLMTAGVDGRWRRATIRAADPRPGQRVLDVATGTGKLALLAARAVGPEGEVIGLDASQPMLDRARRAADRAGLRPGSIRWVFGDAMALPMADASVDAVTIGFGLRNLPDIDAALAEMVRVLRPGGRVAVLEIAVPRGGIGLALFRTWFRGVVPRLGRLARRPQAYAYLPASLDRYPPPDEIERRMLAAGLAPVRWRWLPTGLATLHLGRLGSAR